MRKTLGVSLLVLLLTSSVNAGLIPNETPAPPPPPQTAMVEEPTIQETNDVADEDSLTETALDLLTLLSSLL